MKEKIDWNRINIAAIKREPLVPISTINLAINNQCSNHIDK
jgi:hypothetical protein